MNCSRGAVAPGNVACGIGAGNGNEMFLSPIVPMAANFKDNPATGVGRRDIMISSFASFICVGPLTELCQPVVCLLVCRIPRLKRPRLSTPCRVETLCRRKRRRVAPAFRSLWLPSCRAAYTRRNSRSASNQFSIPFASALISCALWFKADSGSSI